MSAWAPKKGTLEVDRTFPGIGRVRLRTGTHNKRLATAYESMLEQLPLSIVKLLVDRKLELRVVWDAWRSGQLSTLPTAATLQSLAEAVRTWIDAPPDPVGSSEKANREATRTKLEQLEPHAQIQQLPQLLRQLRESMREKASAFNHHRAAALAFLRDTLGTRSELYHQVGDVRPLHVERKFARHPCTVAEARAIATALGATWGPIWFALCATGLGPKEYWNDGWTVTRDGVEVRGQKRLARNRVVPFVVQMPQPIGRPAGFAEALERADLGVTPYDARRSYARWLDELGLPGYRQDAYLGHGPKSMRELYKWGEIRAWLVEDGGALRKYLGAKALEAAK